MILFRLLSGLGWMLTRADGLPVSLVVIALMALPLQGSQIPATADEPKVAVKSERIVFWQDGRLASIQPDGKDFRWVAKERPKEYSVGPTILRLSPDGKYIAYGLKKKSRPILTLRKDESDDIYIKNIGDAKLGRTLNVKGIFACWAPDGTKLVVGQTEIVMKKIRIRNFLVNVTTKEASELRLPEGHLVTDWSSDGKWFLTTSIAPGLKPDSISRPQINLVKRDGSQIRTLTTPSQFGMIGRFSPDGRRVLLLLRDPKKGHQRIFVTDVKGGKPKSLVSGNMEALGMCWSPDGKRIAYTWRQHHADGKPGQQQTESFLEVIDVDGNNHAVLLTVKSPNPLILLLSSPAWR